MSLNNEERQALSQFLNQLTGAPAPAKLPEADSLIRDAIAKQPDAAYLLVQRVMLMEQALNAAKAQIAQLESRVQSNSGANGFLGNNPWGSPAPAGMGSAGVPGVGNYQMPQAGAPMAGRNWSGSSFLGNVATTAAGVVAGSFLFQGIESLMGHHSSGWGNSAFGDHPQEYMSEQTTINNYYDSTPDNNQYASGDDAYLASDDTDYDAGSSGDDSSWV